MPCYDYREDEENAKNAELVKKLKPRLDRVTAMLCKVMRYIDSGAYPPLDDEIFKWWEEHKKADEKRRSK